ncbi:MAG TPA: hypothetical protein VJV78_18680 [Polyangiales bacterium]|nr:hypothetical protein [Polyangiales bacterium]
MKSGTSCDVCPAGSDSNQSKAAIASCSGKAEGARLMMTVSGEVAAECRGQGACQAACVLSQLCCHGLRIM